MFYIPMSGSQNINILLYTQIGGSTKNVKTFTPIVRWIAKDLTKFDDKYASFL